MKRVVKISVVFVVLLLTLLLTTLFVGLRFPQLYFRQEWVISYLTKQDFARNWKWQKLEIELTSPAFLEYLVSVETEDLDADYEDQSLRTHVKNADIFVKARIRYSFLKGLSVLPLSPIRIDIQDSQFVQKEIAHVESDRESVPIQPFRWKELLNEIQAASLPDIKLDVHRFALENLSLDGTITSVLSVSQLKARFDEDTFNLTNVLDFPIAGSAPIDVLLKWDPEKLSLKASSKKLSLLNDVACEFSATKLRDVEKPSPLEINCTSRLVSPPLISKVQGPSLPLTLKFFATVAHDLADPALADVSLDLRSPNPSWNLLAEFAAPKISLNRVLLEPARAVEELLPQARAEIRIPKIKRFLKTFPPGYDSAPAPISAMDGPLDLKVTSTFSKGKLNTQTSFSTHLRGAEQEIKIRVEGLVPWDTANPSKPIPGPLEIALFVDQFRLMLPRVSVREPLPALVGDSRIKHGAPKTEKKSKNSVPLDWSLAIKTESPVAFKTSLLKEEFKFLLDLVVGPDGPHQGSVSLLPMKAEILRRPIEVQNFVVRWTPHEEAKIEGRLRFPLPEYEIFLKVEGPLSGPRTALESSPPLDTNDIYAVLLFGRPMNELDPEGRQGIGRVQQGLAQGFFSLSTLYLLAGSRIESLGFDPNTNDVSAQLRIDRRHTLRVGTQEGQGSVVIRRSLGGGWFIESSAQDNGRSGEQNTNFGLLLQRIIAY